MGVCLAETAKLRSLQDLVYYFSSEAEVGEEVRKIPQLPDVSIALRPGSRRRSTRLIDCSRWVTSPPACARLGTLVATPRAAQTCERSEGWATRNWMISCQPQTWRTLASGSTTGARAVSPHLVRGPSQPFAFTAQKYKLRFPVEAEPCDQLVSRITRELQRLLTFARGALAGARIACPGDSCLCSPCSRCGAWTMP